MSADPTWPRRYARFIAYITAVSDRGKALDNVIQDRGWKLAASVGIPRDGCSLHNASIDDALSGWCHKNPERLRVAKRARYLTDQWPGSRLAERIYSRAYARLMAGGF